MKNPEKNVENLLPNELLTYIFSLLDVKNIKELTGLRLVNKHWKEVVENPLLWKNITFSPKNLNDIISYKEVGLPIVNLSLAKYICLSNTELERWLFSPEKLPHLQSLAIGRDTFYSNKIDIDEIENQRRISINLQKINFQVFTKLKTLYLHENSSGILLEHILSNSNIENLAKGGLSDGIRLHDTIEIYNKTPLPLKTIEIIKHEHPMEEQFMDIVLRSNELEKLRLYGIEEGKIEFFRQINHSSLKSLDLTFFRMDEQLNAVLDGLSNLERLKLGCGTIINSDTIGYLQNFTKLKHLNFSEIEIDGHNQTLDLTELLKKLPDLEKIYLDVDSYEDSVEYNITSALNLTKLKECFLNHNVGLGLLLEGSQESLERLRINARSEGLSNYIDDLLSLNFTSLKSLSLIEDRLEDLMERKPALSILNKYHKVLEHQEGSSFTFYNKLIIDNGGYPKEDTLESQVLLGQKNVTLDYQDQEGVIRVFKYAIIADNKDVFACIAETPKEFLTSQIITDFRKLARKSQSTSIADFLNNSQQIRTLDNHYFFTESYMESTSR